ncbi:Hypothetical predicted protein [Xyrichtys novacula]|uniref:Uncharacterized protein n=1 Tax=Xyrichtys novacula TaxID=13765 RepID=A0AAV1FUM9_XYRNO|nr:Hypothetical predicted protein [Xyrichtys novacula]
MEGGRSLDLRGRRVMTTEEEEEEEEEEESSEECLLWDGVQGGGMLRWRDEWGRVWRRRRVMGGLRDLAACQLITTRGIPAALMIVRACLLRLLALYCNIRFYRLETEQKLQLIRERHEVCLKEQVSQNPANIVQESPRTRIKQVEIRLKKTLLESEPKVADYPFILILSSTAALKTSLLRDTETYIQRQQSDRWIGPVLLQGQCGEKRNYSSSCEAL